MMDGSGSAPCSDLDGDVDVVQSNVNDAQPPSQQQQQQQHDTSTKRMMESEKSSDGSSLPMGLAFSGANGDATNLTTSICNATNAIVDRDDGDDNTPAAAAAAAAAAASNDVIVGESDTSKAQDGPEEDDGDDVVVDKEPAQQTIAINGETIFSISQNVDQRCGSANTSNDTSSSCPIMESTHSLPPGTRGRPSSCNSVEIITSSAMTLTTQEEAPSNNNMAILLPSHNVVVSPSIEEQDDSIMMDSIKLTSSVVSASQTNYSSSVVVVVDPDSPTQQHPPPTPNNVSESSWCDDVMFDQHRQHHEDGIIANNELHAKETITNNDEAAMGCEDDEGGFTVIELVSPGNTNTTTTTTITRHFPRQTTEAITSQQQQQQLESDGDYNIVPSLAEDTMAPLLPPTISSTAATSTNNNAAPRRSVPSSSEEAYSTSSSCPPLSSPPPPLRKKILRHPILTPLTRLPWDRFISAAGACDVLFNCKYSMRQVEDEVREEERKVCGGGGMGYHIGYGGEVGLGGGGEVRMEVEQQQQHHQQGEEGGGSSTVREDGYVNINLGHDCLDYGYDDREGCDADEYSKLGLDCCSILDSDDVGEEEETEGVAGHPTAQPLTTSDEMMGGERWEHVATAKGEGDKNCTEGGGERPVAHPSVSSISPLRPNVISNDQKADRSWKNSNPSLDMLLYRTMLNE